MIEETDVLKLHLGQTIYQMGEYNADGTALRWRVNGQVKTWKRRPGYKVPVKHGLYDYGYLTDYNAHLFTLEEPEPRRRNKRTAI
jgi:hypothetical protein